MPEDDIPKNFDLGNFPPEYKESDRKRGIFTKKDREYLLDKLEIAGQDERNLRYRVRQRVIQALHDLRLLSDSYPDEELKKVIEHDSISERATALSLVNIAYYIHTIDPRSTTEEFEQVLEQAIRRQQIRQIPVPSELEGLHDIEIDVEISVKKADLQEVIDSLVKSEADSATWAALARRVDVYDRVGIFDSEETELISYQPPGAENSIMIQKRFMKMIERSKEKFG